jgi:hypothetical protein
MALYGEARDISMFRYVNRELMHNIISQECVLYKFNLDETKVNVYGEASSNKYYNRPVILYCLIETPDQNFPVSDLGVDFGWKPTFRFLKDDLLKPTYPNNGVSQNDNPYGANIVPQVGDIIMYQKGYFEIDNVDMTQFFVGKDPDYPFDDSLGQNVPAAPQNINPLPETDLNRFGYNVSVICQTHYVPADKVQITLERF